MNTSAYELSLLLHMAQVLGSETRKCWPPRASFCHPPYMAQQCALGSQNVSRKQLSHASEASTSDGLSKAKSSDTVMPCQYFGVMNAPTWAHPGKQRFQSLLEGVCKNGFWSSSTGG